MIWSQAYITLSPRKYEGRPNINLCTYFAIRRIKAYYTLFIYVYARFLSHKEEVASPFCVLNTETSKGLVSHANAYATVKADGALYTLLQTFARIKPCFYRKKSTNIS